MARSAAKRSRASGRFPWRAAISPPRNSALPERGSSCSARSMRRAARPSSSLWSESASASACPDQRLGALAAAQAVGARESAHRERILLQHDVGASQHQPAVEILRIVLELAREARHHGLGGIAWRGRAPRPVAPAQVQPARPRAAAAPLAASAAREAGALPAGVGRSSGTTTTATAARESAAASNTKVTISAADPLRGAASSVPSNAVRSRTMRHETSRPDQQQHRGRAPQPGVAPRVARPEQDEVPVARRHPGAHLLVRLAREQLLAHLAAQIRRRARPASRRGTRSDTACSAARA